MHDNGTAKQADDRISTPGNSQAVRGNSDLPARAWGAASTPGVQSQQEDHRLAHQCCRPVGHRRCLLRRRIRLRAPHPPTSSASPTGRAPPCAAAKPLCGSALVDTGSGKPRLARCFRAKRRSRRSFNKAAAAARRCHMAPASILARAFCASAAVASLVDCDPSAAAAPAPVDGSSGDEDDDVHPSAAIVGGSGGTGPPVAADAAFAMYAGG